MKGERSIYSAIEARLPALRARLESAKKQADSVIRPDDASRRSTDWGQLVERWLEGWELKPDTVYAVTGFGDGRHLIELLRRLPTGAFVFCAEPDPAALLGDDAERIACDVLSDPRFFIGLGELDIEFFQSLSEFPTVDIMDARPLVFAPLYNQRPEYYARFLSEFTRALDYWRRLHGTNATASGKWQGNTLENARALIDAPDVSAAAGRFKDSVIILVAAGPSLDESMDFIEANQRNCLVIAVNSSFRALRNRGIVPPFVIAADPNEYAAKGFEGVSCSETILICPFIVYPEVVKRFPNRILTWSRNHLLASYLRLTAGKRMGSGVTELGTVTACVFDIAKVFGSRAIVFAGQDLAARSDGQLHASDTFYSDIGDDRLRSDDYRCLPGNSGEDVRVEGKLYVYLKGLEGLAKSHGSGMQFFNIAANGARIDGIPYACRDEVMQRLSGRLSPESIERGMDGVKRALRERQDSAEKLDESLHSLSRFAKSVCSLALKQALGLDRALAAESNALAVAIEAAKAGKRELQALLDENGDPAKLLDDGAMKYEMTRLSRAKRGLYREADENRREAALLEEHFWAVAEGAFSFYRSVEKGRLNR